MRPTTTCLTTRRITTRSPRSQASKASNSRSCREVRLPAALLDVGVLGRRCASSVASSTELAERRAGSIQVPLTGPPRQHFSLLSAISARMSSRWPDSSLRATLESSSATGWLRSTRNARALARLVRSVAHRPADLAAPGRSHLHAKASTPLAPLLHHANGVVTAGGEPHGAESAARRCARHLVCAPGKVGVGRP
jgi:hypothetical protein